MINNTEETLHNEGVFKHGSNELNKFEKQITTYFAREYKRYESDTPAKVDLNIGPVTSVSEDLADKHYDAELSLFTNFLDSETMAYSMAYYDEDPKKVLSSQLSLSEAQVKKFTLIAERMELKGDESLLNFGCGFAYLESFLLNKYPKLRITSLTHSKDHFDHVLNRKNDTSDVLSTERFSLYHGEINNECIDLLGTSKYDMVCSVGLMEHVNNIELFFNIISKLLKKKGRMFHHLIVSRDLIPQLLDSEKTLIGDYFPGGKLIPFYAMKQQFNDFELKQSWFINGMNYWKTLDEWHISFWENIDQIYPKLMDTESIRYWNNYFVLCKALFHPEMGEAFGNGQYLFYKKN